LRYVSAKPSSISFAPSVAVVDGKQVIPSSQIPIRAHSDLDPETARLSW